METNFLSNKWNGTNISENNFTHQKVAHRAKLSFYGVLKHFRQKLTKKLAITHKVTFSQWVWKEENTEEMFWIDGNDFFGKTN